MAVRPLLLLALVCHLLPLTACVTVYRNPLAGPAALAKPAPGGPGYVAMTAAFAVTSDRAPNPSVVFDLREITTGERIHLQLRPREGAGAMAGAPVVFAVAPGRYTLDAGRLHVPPSFYKSREFSGLDTDTGLPAGLPVLTVASGQLVHIGTVHLNYKEELTQVSSVSILWNLALTGGQPDAAVWRDFHSSLAQRPGVYQRQQDDARWDWQPWTAAGSLEGH